MKRYSRNSTLSSAMGVTRLSHEADRSHTSARSHAVCPESAKGAAALVCCSASIGYSEKSQGHSPCEHMNSVAPGGIDR